MVEEGVRGVGSTHSGVTERERGGPKDVRGKGTDGASSVARRLQLASAGLAGGLAGCLFYSLDRTRAALGEAGYDPLMVIGTTRIDYFWRVALSIFIATLIAAGWHWLAAGREERIWQLTASATVPVVAFVALLSAVFP